MGRRTGTTWAFRTLAVPAAALLLLGLTACGDDAAEQAGDPAADGTGNGPGIAIGNTGLPAGEYLATEVTENGKPRKLVPGTHISLTFREGQVHARAGCNQMSGPARLAAGKLVVDDLAQTEMGCPGDGRHEQDTFVGQFLTARPAFTGGTEGYGLATATVSMTFAPRAQVLPDLPLEGTRWNVTHTTSGPAADAADDPNAAVSAGMAPPKAYLEFADGKVTGSDGCNRISGSAVVAGDTITFGPIAATKMACPGVSGTEAVHEALTGEVTWRINHNVLTLTSASGAGLQLQAAEGAGEKTGGKNATAAPSSAATPPCCKPAATAAPTS